MKLEKSKKDIEKKGEQLDGIKKQKKSLEGNKKKLMDLGLEAHGKLDPDTWDTVHDLINKELENNSQKAKELSKSADNILSDVQSYENEIKESQKANLDEQKKMGKTIDVLSKVGLGKHLEKGKNKLEKDMNEMKEEQDNINKIKKDILGLNLDTI